MDKELCKELRKITIEIEEYRKTNPDSEQMDAQIIDVIKKVIRIARICRREGLLALEEASYEIEGELLCSDLLRQIAVMVVDGNEPEIVQEFAVARYYALNLHAYEALAAMIYIEFAGDLQANKNPFVTEKMVIALVPDHIEKAYRNSVEQEETEYWYGEDVRDEVDMSVVDKVCSESHTWAMDEDGYFLIKLFEIVLSGMEARSIQIIMSEVEKETLIKAMRGLSEEGKRIIFGCASDRFAVMLAEDIRFRGEVRITEVIKAVQEMLTLILKKMGEAKIPNTGFAFFEKMYDVFEIKTAQPERSASDLERTVFALRNLFNEYNQRTKVWI